MAKNKTRPEPTLRFGNDRHAFKDLIVEQLASIPELSARPMFGGFGLYAGEKFFGLVWRDVLYFRTSAATVDRYLAAGMDCFRPNPQQELKSYYEVPADIVDRRAALCEWARQALAA